MFEIANYFIDESGMYFVRVILSPEEAQFFKFKEMPTQDEVDAAVQKYLEAINGSTQQDNPPAA